MLKESWSVILISDKLDFKPDCNKRWRWALYHNKGAYPIRKSNNCKYLCPQHGRTKYINQLIRNIKKLIDNDTIIVGDFQHPSYSNGQIIWAESQQGTMALNDTLDWMDLQIYSEHFILKQNTFFLRARGTFSRMDHILGHKSALNKYKKTMIIWCIF